VHEYDRFAFSAFEVMQLNLVIEPDLDRLGGQPKAKRQESR
jgi:hypothetical protein